MIVIPLYLTVGCYLRPSVVVSAKQPSDVTSHLELWEALLGKSFMYTVIGRRDIVVSPEPVFGKTFVCFLHWEFRTKSMMRFSGIVELSGDQL